MSFYTKYVLLILLLCCNIMAKGASLEQDSLYWQQYFTEYAEANEDMSEEEWEDIFEQLSTLAEDKIDLRTADENELRRLPFLNEQQIEDLAYHIYRYGGMRSLGELTLIPSLSYNERRLLSQFVYISEKKEKGFPSLKNIARYSTHELSADIDIPTYNRLGDEDGSYLGYPLKHTLRWQMRYGKYLKLGFVGAQDAGEPFFADCNRMGYDLYSFHLLLTDVNKWIKTIALGSYKVQMGMGLVINNGMTLGKTQTLSSLGRNMSSITASTSRSMGNYLQGVAITIEPLKHLQVTAFASLLPLDGTPTKNGGISSINTSGYHRTLTELERKYNFTESVVGGNIAWQQGGWRLGTTATYVHLSKPLQPNTSQFYRMWYPAGSDFTNASIYYGYNHYRLSVAGETATDANGHLATINTLQWRPARNMQLTALQRYYSSRYTSILARSFSEGGRIQNESGAYLSMIWHAVSHLTLTAYADYAYFAWPRYQSSLSSSCLDTYLQVAYEPGKWRFTARYRFKQREMDNADKTALIPRNQNTARLSASYSGSILSETTQVDLSHQSYKSSSTGFAVTQSFNVNPVKWIQLSAQGSRFNTFDYDSRIYIFERGLLHSLSSLAFYGNGIRMAFLIRADLGKATLIAKCGSTHYYDREQISSGHQLIDSSWKTDVQLQVRVKL